MAKRPPCKSLLEVLALLLDKPITIQTRVSQNNNNTSRSPCSSNHTGSLVLPLATMIAAINVLFAVFLLLEYHWIIGSSPGNDDSCHHPAVRHVRRKSFFQQWTIPCWCWSDKIDHPFHHRAADKVVSQTIKWTFGALTTERLSDSCRRPRSTPSHTFHTSCLGQSSAILPPIVPTWLPARF